MRTSLNSIAHSFLWATLWLFSDIASVPKGNHRFQAEIVASTSCEVNKNQVRVVEYSRTYFILRPRGISHLVWLFSGNAPCVLQWPC